MSHGCPENAADLSVVMPCYNEEQTILQSISRLLDLSFVHEVVVVDDASTDSSAELVRTCLDSRVRLIQQPVNQGKGAALRRGFAEVTGTYVAIQDADLEYDPVDLGRLILPLRDGRADVVYGSRFIGGAERRVLLYWHSLGNKVLTLCSNMTTNLNLTDMETCYKVFRTEVIQNLDLRENRFGFEPEVTAKIAARGLRVYELGISYAGRTYAEGKKISWRDGVRAFFAIAKYSPPASRISQVASRIRPHHPKKDRVRRSAPLSATGLMRGDIGADDRETTADQDRHHAG